MVGQVRGNSAKRSLQTLSVQFFVHHHHHQPSPSEKEHPLGIIVSGSKPIRCISSKSYRAFSGCSPFSQALMSVLGSRPHGVD